MSQDDEGAVIVRLTAPWFVAALVLRDNKVRRAAPIIGYMRGWELCRVADYCALRSWTWESWPSSGRAS